MSVTAASKTTVEVFISYSHKDQELCELLKAHLTSLKNENVIRAWHDRKITAGQEWDLQIREKLESARVILLLISADFLASDYCHGVEVKRALERHKAETARVIPVVLRPVDWRNSPFGELQALPDDAEPITKWSNIDSAFLNVAQGIRRVAEQISDEEPDPDLEPRPTEGEKPQLVNKVYTFCGLDTKRAPREEDDDVLFQDFDVDEDVNGEGIINNPICYLWADARAGNYIKTSVAKTPDNDRRHDALEIEFRNDPATWPSNLAIFPQDLRARRRMEKQIALSFDARALDDGSSQSPVVIMVRVVDELLRHWRNIVNPVDEEDRLFQLPADGSWQTFAVNLGSRNHWKLYLSDGNRTSPATEPEFKLISSLVLVVGRAAGKRLEGSGKLQIANIQFRSQFGRPK